MHVTRHAVDRWRERVGLPLGLLQPGLADAVDVPGRFIGPHIARRWTNRTDPRARGTSYRCSSSAVYIVWREKVLTIIDLEVDDLASVLVWTMTQMWV